MENIKVDLKSGIITVTLSIKVLTEVEALQEASKILQREVLRRGYNSSQRFYR